MKRLKRPVTSRLAAALKPRLPAGAKKRCPQMAPNRSLDNLPQTRLFELKSDNAAGSVDGAKQTAPANLCLFTVPPLSNRDP